MGKIKHGIQIHQKIAPLIDKSFVRKKAILSGELVMQQKLLEIANLNELLATFSLQKIFNALFQSIRTNDLKSFNLLFRVIEAESEKAARD